MINKRIVLILLFLFYSIMILFGNDYWVSPTGEASWANAQSGQPLNGTLAASLATANNNAMPGDTINMRDGIYNTMIFPTNSGAGEYSTITYSAYGNEKPIISGTNQGGFIGIYLNGNKKYIRVIGITVRNVDRWLQISRGSSHNEIAYCSFEPSADIGLRIWRGATGEVPATNNWLHHNIAYGQGYVTNEWDDHGNIMQIGILGLDGHSGNNTIENNVFYHGAHHIIETFSSHNVIRSNVMHNEGWMDAPENPIGVSPYGPDSNGKYGNRLIGLFDQPQWNRDGVYNLVENNRLGHAGRPPDDDGADVLDLTGHKNIVRYNYIYNAGKDGIYFRAGDPGFITANNRVFNNTIYHNGYNGEGYYDHRRVGIFYRTDSTDNVIINNIVYDNYNHDIFSWYPNDLHGNTISNNWLTTDGDPQFKNTDISNPMSLEKPDLTLNSDSGAIDAGIALTKAVGSGNNSTTLIVEDALFFQDGTMGSSLTHGKNFFSDSISIGSTGTYVAIKEVDYLSNTIILENSMNWSDGDEVFLYSDSSKRRVLSGSAPDIGAFEYIGETNKTSIQKPKSIQLE